MIATLLTVTFIASILVALYFFLGDYLISMADPKNKPRFFCQIPKGKFVTIMLGGMPSMYLGSPTADLYFDRTKGIVVKPDEMTAEQKDQETEFLYFVLKYFFGIAWIGFYGKVAEEKFQFKEIEDGGIKNKGIDTPYVKFQHTYVEYLGRFDTLDRFSIGLWVQITIQVWNVPLLRFTQGKSWLATVWAAVEDALRGCNSNMTYDEVMRECIESSNSKMLRAVMSLGVDDVGNVSLLKKLGIVITGMNIMDIKPLDERMHRASTEKFISEKMGDKMRTDAQNRADVLAIDSTAKAKATKVIADAKKYSKQVDNEIEKIHIENYNGKPPEMLWPENFGKTRGTFFFGEGTPAVFPLAPRGNQKKATKKTGKEPAKKDTEKKEQVAPDSKPKQPERAENQPASTPEPPKKEPEKNK